MTIFCDTNILIAAFLESHAHHAAARPVLERIHGGKDKGFVAAHSLAEAFSVLTRLPGADHVEPILAWQLLKDNILKTFTIVALNAREYAEVLRNAAEENVSGGRIYDLILLAAAAKTKADRILTFNIQHFRSLASPTIRPRIVSP